MIDRLEETLKALLESLVSRHGGRTSMGMISAFLTQGWEFTKCLEDQIWPWQRYGFQAHYQRMWKRLSWGRSFPIFVLQLVRRAEYVFSVDEYVCIPSCPSRIKLGCTLCCSLRRQLDFSSFSTSRLDLSRPLIPFHTSVIYLSSKHQSPWSTLLPPLLFPLPLLSLPPPLRYVKKFCHRCALGATTGTWTWTWRYSGAGSLFPWRIARVLSVVYKC